jgi:RHS repeat-associated protein
MREYNDAGELVRITNALGEVTELTYDALGRMTSRKTRTGSQDEKVTYLVYDEQWEGRYNVGFLTTVSHELGARYTAYDQLGRLSGESNSIDGTVYWKEHTYNAAGLPSTIYYSDGRSITRTYDVAGNLYSETGTISANLYNAFGQATSTTYTNGVTTAKTFSPTRGWIESIETTSSDTTHQHLDYNYLPDGMIQTITSVKSAESWSYTYDALNRLTQSTNVDTPALSQTFQYEPTGNITYNSQIGTYTYPQAGQPRPHAVQYAGGRTYQYNAMGQMTNRNGTVIQWNGDGKPSSIGNIGFTYDGLGERIKKVSGGQTTLYPFTDYEIAHDGTTTKSLVGGKQVCGTSGCEFFMYHRDHLGSVQSITNASGEVLHKKYTPFGDTHTAVGSHSDLRGWIGEREEETELVYLNARYYDPEIGRFISPDPFAELGQGLSRYTYSLNNPINSLDPSGLWSVTCTFGGDPNGGGCHGGGFGDFGRWVKNVFGAIFGSTPPWYERGFYPATPDTGPKASETFKSGTESEWNQPEMPTQEIVIPPVQTCPDGSAPPCVVVVQPTLRPPPPTSTPDVNTPTSPFVTSATETFQLPYNTEMPTVHVLVTRDSLGDFPSFWERIDINRTNTNNYVNNMISRAFPGVAGQSFLIPPGMSAVVSTIAGLHPTITEVIGRAKYLGFGSKVGRYSMGQAAKIAIRNAARVYGFGVLAYQGGIWVGATIEAVLQEAARRSNPLPYYPYQ